MEGKIIEPNQKCKLDLLLCFVENVADFFLFFVTVPLDDSFA
jgi:hypothetical protein